MCVLARIGKRKLDVSGRNQSVRSCEIDKRWEFLSVLEGIALHVLRVSALQMSGRMYTDTCV
jgi:hypothetical protein